MKRVSGLGIALIPLAMFGVGFAAKPLYDTFCRVTGFGGTVQRSDVVSAAVLDRKVQVRFDAGEAPDALTFVAGVQALSLRIGETALAWYELTNNSDGPVAAIASYNVVPHKAGRYFSKLECFCFERRVFAPGETRRLPVVFYIDPEFDSKTQLDDIRQITLSYTMHAVPEPGGGAAQTVSGVTANGS